MQAKITIGLLHKRSQGGFAAPSKLMFSKTVSLQV